MKPRRELFGAMAAAGFVLGLLGVQLVPMRIVAPEEPAWRQFGHPARAEPDPYFSYVDFLPDFGRMPAYLPGWAEVHLPPLPDVPPEPLPEPPPVPVLADNAWDALPPEGALPELVTLQSGPVLARTGPREVQVLTGAPPQASETLSAPVLPTDLVPLPVESEDEDEVEEAFGG